MYQNILSEQIHRAIQHAPRKGEPSGAFITIRWDIPADNGYLSFRVFLPLEAVYAPI